MSKATIDINEASQKLLSELADKTGQNAAEVIDKALLSYRRELFFNNLNAGYAELRADPKAWAEHEAEREQWDQTLMDGINAGETWDDEGRCLTPEMDKDNR
jgi:predicted transcriptional regulator